MDALIKYEVFKGVNIVTMVKITDDKTTLYVLKADHALKAAVNSGLWQGTY